MKIKLSHLLIPALGAATAALTVSVGFWDNSKAAILTALSVIGAGVLVRLARGLPFTNVDQFQLDEARKISAAVKQSIRALRILIFVILIAMASLVLVKGLADAAIAALPPDTQFVEPVASGLIGLLLSYIFVRITAVIQGDVALVDLQSEFFVRAVERKQGERFEKARNSASDLPPANPKGYGKVVQ
ncbi:hypothetical protein I7F13_21120 [Sinorhizobium meliloti]|uniref:hypothetical protein n=1 Tax=Rhizobium meliloti TaxID=382 RepID=UPI000FD9EA38|nr:hypothetical protein [Sinorhizobium meliloti]MDE3824688.1 hypothetical protein [Sinorhizobium meliloti]RVM41622.1 hypothetical protein CN127_29990 [Sinorhizobium meliloti]RVN58825.1 hypothetical protein CN106_31475 [Sinorhizobium meliloti]